MIVVDLVDPRTVFLDQVLERRGSAVSVERTPLVGQEEEDSPPCCSTRWISSRKRRGFARCSSTWLAMTKSCDPSSIGPSPSTSKCARMSGIGKVASAPSSGTGSSTSYPSIDIGHGYSGERSNPWVVSRTELDAGADEVASQPQASGGLHPRSWSRAGEFHVEWSTVVAAIPPVVSGSVHSAGRHVRIGIKVLLGVEAIEQLALLPSSKATCALKATPPSPSRGYSSGPRR